MKDIKSERAGSSAVENKHTSGNQKALKDRQKRADMQLYVPRALRGVKTVSLKNDENLNQQCGKKTSHKSAGASNLTDSLVNLPSVSSEQNHKKKSININLKQKSIKNEFDNAVRFSTDEAVVQCATTFIAASNNVVVDETLSISTSHLPTEMDDLQNFQSSSSSCLQTAMPCYTDCTKSVDNTNAVVSENVTENIEIVDNANAAVSKNLTEDIDKSVIVEIVSENIVDLKKEEMVCTVKSAPCKIIDAKTNCTMLENVLCTDSCHASDMDLLNISDKSDETHTSLKTAESSYTLSKEKGESWESMFDDDGECLDSDLVKELSSVTGKIQARAAKNNYVDYQPISESVPQEYEHIVELYGFPREFVTQDLVSAFSIFQQSSFSIKWVDDCHALAIFTSPNLANQALQIKHPFMKVRPLSEGIKESKAKARWCAQHSEPQKPRPATSAVLARRLVSGALGLRVQATKEQRDHERSVLKEAKEKRRQKAKQKEAIWDGSVI